jgi:aminopeptidase-like protein
MIGFDKTPPVSGLIETKRFSEDFINKFKAVSDKIGKLEISTSYNPWGSDHVPFLNKNIPCFLFIEEEYGANPNYHRTTDTLKYVNMELVAETTRVVVETLTDLIK